MKGRCVSSATGEGGGRGNILKLTVGNDGDVTDAVKKLDMCRVERGAQRLLGGWKGKQFQPEAGWCLENEGLPLSIRPRISSERDRKESAQCSEPSRASWRAGKGDGMCNTHTQSSVCPRPAALGKPRGLTDCEAASSEFLMSQEDIERGRSVRKGTHFTMLGKCSGFLWALLA